MGSGAMRQAPTEQLHSYFCKSKQAFVLLKCFSTSNVNPTTESYEIHGTGFAVSIYTWGG